MPFTNLAAIGVCTAVAAGSWNMPPPAPVADIPPDYIAAYQAAAPACPGLDWTTLAAIGKAETDHGREAGTAAHSGENSAGAAGPLQFLQPTFTEVQQAHPDVAGDRYDVTASTHAAAHYLCDNGASRGDLRGAIYAYNPTQAYVDHVLRQADAYRAAAQDANEGRS